MKKGSRVWIISLLFLASVLINGAAQAETIGWTQWSSMSYGKPGQALGTITLPGGAIIDVTYTGEIIQTIDSGNWDVYPGTYSLPGVIENHPSPFDVSIQLIGGSDVFGQFTISQIDFSSPVLNPVLAVQSLGSSIDRAIYEFTSSEPFTIVVQGPGHWGGGYTSLSKNATGNQLIGYEGNGVIQFTGTYSRITWIVRDEENYHVFTVGAPLAAPEPTTILLFGLGLVGLAGIRRKLFE